MLANTLKYKCFDVDTMVELTHEKKPVAEIFKEFGQEYFRDCESQVEIKTRIIKVATLASLGMGASEHGRQGYWPGIPAGSQDAVSLQELCGGHWGGVQSSSP